MGEERIATKYNSEGNNNTQAERERTYYYHSDHLGSAQTITNWRGQIHERLEYTPYGELWIDWKTTGDGDVTPFRFTGKEYDQETGLYYYGARYLDPKVSRWISGDPAMGEYVPAPGQGLNDLPGIGGVFNIINLHAYRYAGNNPVKYIDPDGRENKIGPHYPTITNAINFDFGRDYVDLALANFRDGYYGLAGIQMLSAVSEATYNSLAAFGLANAISAIGTFVGPLFINKAPELQDRSFSLTTELTSAAQRAIQKLGPGKGPLYGTRAHALFQNEVRALNKVNFRTEVSYFAGRQVRHGYPGSIRLDVVEYTGGEVSRVFDLKTGGATLTLERIRQIQNAVGKNIPVIEIKP